MENWNIIEILKLGLPGLVFLLSMLSYRLLSKEQGKKAHSLKMLSSIKIFMYINVAFAMLTLASPIIDYTFFTKSKIFDIDAKIGITDLEQEKAAVCYNADYSNRYLLIKDIKTGRLIQVFAASLIPCGTTKLIGLSNKDAHQLGWTTENSGMVEVVTAPPGYKFVI